MSRIDIDVPEGIAGLAPDAEDRVQALVRDARRRQLAELAQALDHAMRVIPRPLRGTVRRVLGL